MTLIKTGLLNAIAVAVRMLTALLLNKILAVQVGAAGYAVIGQFQNFITMVTTVASGAVNTGVTKYTAEHFDDEAHQFALWRTAGTLALAGSLIAGMLIAFSRDTLARHILRNTAFADVFLWLGACLVLFVLNALLLAILNGKKEISRYVAVNIAGSLVSLAVTGILAMTWGLHGALIALAVNQSIVFLVTLSLCARTSWFAFDRLVGKIDRRSLHGLGKFALMALVSAVCVPGAQILIRDHLGTQFGWNAAGQWEALMRISNLYLTLVTAPLAVYYLPRLSEIRDRAELRHEIALGYRLILPVTVTGAVLIYLLRDWLIKILFTSEFTAMRELFAWQMAGDVAKIGSWLLAYLMLGRAMVKTFIVTEIVFSATWVVGVWLATGWFGVEGAQVAYCVNYLVYGGILALLILKHI